MSVPIISLNNPLPPRFPGEQVVLSFYTPLPVTNLVPKLTLPDGRVLTGTLGSISGSQQNFGFPNIGAIPDPKGATETDVDYVARLQQFQQVVRSYPWSATWTDVANNPYGAIDGVLSGKVLIPSSFLRSPVPSRRMPGRPWPAPSGCKTSARTPPSSR